MRGEVHCCVARKAASRRATALARRVKARLVELGKQTLDTDLVWITVPDDSIAQVARNWRAHRTGREESSSTPAERSPATSWRRCAKKVRRVASVHPMMTFVRGSVPDMAEWHSRSKATPLRSVQAKQIVERLGGYTFPIRKQNKVLYHAFGSFASPLVIALMASLEQVAQAAGVKQRDIKRVMLPLLLQTLRNYLHGGAAAAFSGPLVRGDVATVRKHLVEFKIVPEARNVYVALARSAVKNLPVRNRKAVERELKNAYPLLTMLITMV